MPKMGGLEARHQSSTTNYCVPPIVLPRRAARQRCLEAGMNGYLSKPVRATELYEMIDNF